MYLIFDTETTDFPHWNAPHDYHLQARICQIAAILLNEEFVEVAAFHSLIKPNGWTISDGARNFHGITDEACEKYGLPIKVALANIAAMMEHANHAVCHGIRFDSFMLDVELLNANYPTYSWAQGLCTMKASREICKLRNIIKRGPGLNLGKLYKECFNEEHTNAHDAIGDVRATAKCFEYLVKNGYLIISQNNEEVNSTTV